MVQLNRDPTPPGGDGAKVESVSVQSVLGNVGRYRDSCGVVLVGRDDLASTTLEVIQHFTEVLGRERRLYLHDPLQHHGAGGVERRTKADRKSTRLNSS